MALDYESQLLSGVNWETSTVASGKIRAINKILVNNGVTEGSLLIELYDSANTTYRKIADLNIPAYPVDFADYVQWYDSLFLKENDKLRLTATGSSDITVTIFYSEK